jgi:serine/threonine protein phosphatase PrpC
MSTQPTQSSLPGIPNVIWLEAHKSEETSQRNSSEPQELKTKELAVRSYETLKKNGEELWGKESPKLYGRGSVVQKVDDKAQFVRRSFSLGVQRKGSLHRALPEKGKPSISKADTLPFLSQRGSKKEILEIKHHLERMQVDFHQAKNNLQECLKQYNRESKVNEEVHYDNFLFLIEKALKENQTQYQTACLEFERAGLLSKRKFKKKKEYLAKKSEEFKALKIRANTLKVDYDKALRYVHEGYCKFNEKLFFESEVIIAKNFQAENPTKQVHAEAWNHFDEWTDQIVLQFPDLPLNTSSNGKLGDPLIVDNFNNYGLIPDSGSIKKDSLGQVLSFRLNGEKIIPAIDLQKESQAVELNGLIFFRHNEGTYQYHDHALASECKTGSLLITLSDGAGQSNASKNAAKLASEISHHIAQEGIGTCKSLHQRLKLHFAGVKKAQEVLTEDPGAGQGTTLVQAAVSLNLLTGVAVGDSKVFVFTPKPEGGWRCRDAVGESRRSLDPRDSGGRLSGILNTEKKGDDVEIANIRAFVLKLRPGDVIYACSDGGYDNFDPSQLNDSDNSPSTFGGKDINWEERNPEHLELAHKGLIHNLEKVVKNCTNLQEIHDAILKESQTRTTADKLYFLTTPLTGMKKPPSVRGQGKGDDMAMVFFQYNPS